MLESAREACGMGIWLGIMNHEDERSVIGRSIVTNEPIEIRRSQRRQHLYVVGQTGTGKSTLLRNLLADDIAAGWGCGLIDPHGELAEEILEVTPPHRINDVVYFNVADQEFPIGLNLLQAGFDRQLVGSGVMTALRSIWRDSWGPRMDYILSATINALLECENTSLLGVQRMLTDDAYRRWVLKQVRDPGLRAIWEDEFEAVDRRTWREWIAPIQNKVGQLLMRPVIRNIIGQVKNKVDISMKMDRGQIFIANLSKGRIGEEAANLLGSLLVTQFQLAAMNRANRPSEDRRPFELYVDEFSNFGTDSFAGILSEARKYGLGLVLAHQFTAQLEPMVRESIFGNVGSIIAFRTGCSDAEILEDAFSRDYPASQIVELPNYRIFARVLSPEGVAAAVMGKTLPPAERIFGCSEKIMNQSRMRYATGKREVEGKIANWMEGGRFLQNAL